MPLIPTRRAFLAAGIASTAALALKPGSARAQISPPPADPEDSTLHLVDPQYREMAQAMPAMLFTPDILPDIRAAQDATTVPGSENPVFESFELPDSPASFFLYRPDTLRATPTPAIVYILAPLWPVSNIGSPRKHRSPGRSKTAMTSFLMCFGLRHDLASTLTESASWAPVQAVV